MCTDLSVGRSLMIRFCPSFYITLSSELAPGNIYLTDVPAIKHSDRTKPRATTLYPTQGLGVPVDKKRALQLFQAALRAEGHLDGEAAIAGDKTMAAFYEAKEKGLLEEDEGEEKAKLRVESGKKDEDDRAEDVRPVGENSSSDKVSS